MKLVESADGTIKVIELDPTKVHWLIVDAETMLHRPHFSMRDGTIIVKRPDRQITVVEGDVLPKGLVPLDG